jgi:hypothetical protein
MTASDKRSLIYESVVVTQIDIHHTVEEPNQHVVRATLVVSCTTTFAKSLLSQNWGSAPGMKS